MTTKEAFTDEEWTRLGRAPFVAGMAISLADPGGPIEAVKESIASLKTVQEAAESGGRGELVDSVAKSAFEKAQKRENPLKDFKPRGAMAGEEILTELREVNALVGEKASSEDATSYRQWLLDSAKHAAEAAKEGGFLGWKAERVSEGEQKMLDRLNAELN